MEMEKVSYLLRVTKIEKETWGMAAKEEGRTLAGWMKYHLSKVAPDSNSDTVVLKKKKRQ